MGENHESTLYQGLSSKLVNIDNSNFPGLFSNTTVPSAVNPAILPEPSSNVMAARSQVACGGGRSRRRRIYRSKYKKMRSRTKHRRSRRRRRPTRRHRKQRGGYSQYQNNMPSTPNYSLGGNLSANESALANPPPIQTNIKGACVDNYNHYTNLGFPSRGWH